MDVEQYLHRLGPALATLRNRAGLSQRGLEDAISAKGGGVRPAQISRYETGQAHPNIATLLWILAGCGFDLAALQAELRGEDETDDLAQILRRLLQQNGEAAAAIRRALELAESAD